MTKVIFILHRREGISREECSKQWSSERHTSLVGALPGLTKWKQNHVLSAPGEPVCDGVGELWFENDEVLEIALTSPEMEAAVEDSKNFLDMERTAMIVVEEKSILG